jgi:hypothetical protein
MFSIGAILYKLLTGYDLFDGESTEELFYNNKNMIISN